MGRGGIGEGGTENKSETHTHCSQNTDIEDFGQTILFTNEHKIVKKEMGRIYLDDLGTVFFDEGLEVEREKNGQGDELIRPSTAAVAAN